MEIGFHFVNFSIPGGTSALPTTLANTARAAEEVGAAWFTMADHFFQMESMWPADEPMLEVFSSLAFLAGQTSRIKLVVLVAGITYRYPALLAKTVTTLDVLSRGRAVCGVGAAWYKREHVGLGVPYPSTKERFERLEETVQICQQMWSDNNGGYEGKHYQLAETLCVPQPVQQPHPPILIGGTGERKTLRLVAQYADIWNGIFESTSEAAHKCDVLRRHCDALGRDYDSIQKTVFHVADPFDDLDGFFVAAEQYAKLGFDVMSILPPASNDPLGFVNRLGEELIPKAVQLGS
ncbi:LLM class F420-dependent oxidoreductase [Mycobacterium saskatchewanense]|uniref:LLM class F420-dependent oxidoreductase n=1 Tax=Mycobacterium saskatchewanense TaxID=220927 RepID=A0AAJ3NPM9_9MYCO|nr:LLM class F420-dependent oxidoreductase [Mycobacterium saskatchewanense]ORW71689.1 LLM class F420-dependent oxidoreductase [Mycobacterium saskatchewanense]BBX63514.1 LLM class F420-dependent oxidoreductase [Mycobacterium saskatchewanense]